MNDKTQIIMVTIITFVIAFIVGALAGMNRVELDIPILSEWNVETFDYKVQLCNSSKSAYVYFGNESTGDYCNRIYEQGQGGTGQQLQNLAKFCHIEVVCR